MRKKKRTAIYKPGFVENELELFAVAPLRQSGDDYRHILGMMAAALLMLLERDPLNAKDSGR